MLSKKRVAMFQQEQIEFGTKIAMGNLIWDTLFEAFGMIGVRSVKTQYFKKEKKGKNGA